MTLSQVHALLPILILAGSIILLLLVISFYRNHKLTLALTAFSFAASFFSLWMVPPAEADTSGSFLLVMDNYALFYIGLFLAAGFAVTVLSYGYFQIKKIDFHEFYILLVLATTGASVLAASSHFITLFLGLEILSVSLYTLTAYLRGSVKSTEAGVKYLILAAASSAFLLFGIALLYAETGALDFNGISRKLAIISVNLPLLYSAFCLIIVGFGFKLAVVPFHMWTPDVYEGAPAPVTAYIATVSKGAMFAVLVRFFFMLNVYSYEKLMLIFIVVSIASMFTGNLLALKQNNIKRLLAYSSIAHLGYLLLALIAGGSFAAEAITFYLVSYFITILIAFGIVSVISGMERDSDILEDYSGLSWKRPFIGAVFTASLLSLAGIPLTAGFIGKYYIAFAGIRSRLWVLVAILIINSAISLYYYLRVIAVLYEDHEPVSGGRLLPAVSLAGAAVLAVLTLVLVWIGVCPQTLIDIIRMIL